MDKYSLYKTFIKAQYDLLTVCMAPTFRTTMS